MTRKEWFTIGGDYSQGGYFYDLYPSGYFTYDKLPKESAEVFLRKVAVANYERGFEDGQNKKIEAIKKLLELC